MNQPLRGQFDIDEVEPWCYPKGALSEFCRWLREIHNGDGKFAEFLTRKVQDKELPTSLAQLAVAVFEEEGRLTR